MLYTFKSQVTGNLIMLQPHAERLLQIIGKDTTGKGIVLPEQIAGAVLALEAAVAKDDAEVKATAQAAKDNGENAPRRDAVSLRQRAAPFLDMLKRCQKADREIVWGV
jgi:hypothetical protein